MDSCFAGCAGRAISHFCIWSPAVDRAPARFYVWFLWTGQETCSAWFALWAHLRDRYSVFARDSLPCYLAGQQHSHVPTLESHAESSDDRCGPGNDCATVDVCLRRET